MFPTERITRRRKKKRARANTLDPSQDLGRFSTSASPSPTDSRLKKKADKKRMAKSKSPSAYKPRLEDKIKRRNKKSKGRRRANSDIHGEPMMLKVDIKDTAVPTTKPRPLSTTIRKKTKKSKKKCQSQTPSQDYVGSLMNDDDPFNVKKKLKQKKTKKSSMTPIVSLTETIDESVYSSRSDDDEMSTGGRARTRSQSARFSPLHNGMSAVQSVKLSNSRTITDTTRVLQTVNAGLKKDINRGFHEFRRGLEDQQMQLMDDLETLYNEKKDELIAIEQKLFENGKKSKNAKPKEFEFDPSITLVLHTSDIMQQIKGYGYIEGVNRTRSDSNHVATSSVIIHSDDEEDAKDEDDDEVITMAVKQKTVLGEIQRKTIEKLDMVILMEKEAKKKAKQAAKLTKEVDEGLKYIQERTEIIHEKIAVATPELENARHAVSGIDPKSINEIKTLKAPPIVIENVITATVMILGHNIKTWRDVQKLLSYKFKPQLLNFDTYTLTKQTRKKVYKKYAGKEDFNYDRVYEASKVCGNLVLWVLSQIKYSRMLDIIIPLEKEVKKLKRESNKKKKRAKALLKIVNELEENIKLYTDQCNQMIDHIIKSTDHELKQFSDKLQPLNEKFNALLNNKVLD